MLSSQDFRPHFLIAMPQLLDPRFYRSVILMLEHDEKGALGLVVNQATQMKLKEFTKDQHLPCHESYINDFLFTGGPVQQERGWVLHSDSSIEEKQAIVEGLYLSSSAETLSKLLSFERSSFRLLLGYAGWSEGQLVSEMKQGSWLSAPVTQEHIFSVPPTQLWKTLLKELKIDPAQLVSASGVH
ncbi:MAG: YqgE/AlgH family protein [Deltaproteobacteria bacterium]|nr:YqgE/AlgH family protein [Deltaproteobacteria bacterium]